MSPPAVDPLYPIQTFGNKKSKWRKHYHRERCCVFGSVLLTFIDGYGEPALHRPRLAWDALLGQWSAGRLCASKGPVAGVVGKRCQAQADQHAEHEVRMEGQACLQGVDTVLQFSVARKSLRRG
jgi:hypothetical protein